MKKGSFGLRKGEITTIVDSTIDVKEYHNRHGSIQLMNRVHEIIERNYKSDQQSAVSYRQKNRQELNLVDR